MKRLLLLSGWLILPFCIQAQSLQVLNAQANVSGDGSTTLEAHADIKNTSSTDKIVRCERTQVNTASGHQTYFCWDECYAPPTSISGLDTIAPGATTSIFISYLVPANTNGTSSVMYKFYDVNNPNDSVTQQFTYTISVPTSAEKTLTAKSSHEISTAYPNPAGNFTRIDYDLALSAKDAHVKIYNILGSEIRKIDLHARQGTINLDTENFTEGMYLYSLVVNSKTVSTRKFIIKR